MGDELAAERLHQGGVVARAMDAVGLEVHDRVRSVQGEPALAAGDEVADGFFLLRGGMHVAGVTDEEVGGGDGLGVAVVLADANADVVVFVQQLEDFEAGEVDVVPLSAGDEVGVDSGHGGLPWRVRRRRVAKSPAPAGAGAGLPQVVS